MYNAHFFAQIFEGKRRMHIIHWYYLKYLVNVFVLCNYLFVIILWYIKFLASKCVKK